MTDYSIIRVYTSEKARYEGKDLAQSIVAYVHSLRLAARCLVLRGIEGCYESGEMAASRIVDISYNLPVVIEILLPAAETERVLQRLDAMVLDGIVALLPATVVSARSSSRLLPAHLLVRDCMSRKPVLAHPDFSARVAAELLLDAECRALPVVDDAGLPVGMVTQGDLVERAGMPARIGLLGYLPEERVGAWRRSAEQVRLADIMSPRPHCIREDHRVSEALHLMIRRRVTRLPVVDESGKVVGILARSDVLRAISRAPAAESTAVGAQLPSASAERVRDLKIRDRLSLPATSGVKDAIAALAHNGLLQAAVVDEAGRFLGLISDEDLFRATGSDYGLLSLRRFLRSRTGVGPSIGELMRSDVVTVAEDTAIAEALRLVTERGLKRLPIVEPDGQFKGLIHRDSILMALSHSI